MNHQKILLGALVLLASSLPCSGEAKTKTGKDGLKISIPTKPVGKPQAFVFQKGLKNWSVTGKASGQNGICKLAPKSAIGKNVVVNFGSDTLKPQRYMMIVKIKADETAKGNAATRLGIRTPKDFPRKDYRVSETWKDYYVVIDTPAAMPGRERGTISVGVDNKGYGNLLLKDFRLYQLPQYGIMLRYKILKPKGVLFKDRVNIIRHHRNRGSKNPIERSFFSGINSAGGKNGPKAGKFSQWIDLRPYLFGGKTATTTFSLKPAKPSAKPQPVTVLIEMAYDKRTKTIAPAKEEDELSLTDDDDGLLEDLGKEKLPADVFFRRQIEMPTGTYTFLLPENHVPPDLFVKAFQDIRTDIKRREAYLADLRPLDEKKILVPIGANLSSMERLLPPSLVGKEMELLLKIGINSISRPVDKTISKFYTSLRDEKYSENKRYFDRLYSRVSGESAGLSPYDGDKLHKFLLKFYKPLEKYKDNKNIYVVELLDEPHDLNIYKPDVVPFREFLKARQVTPEMVGFSKWDDVLPYGFKDVVSTLTVGPKLQDVDPEKLGETANIEELTDKKEGKKPEASTTVTLPKDLPLEKRRLYYYTRLFSTQKTSDFFKVATTAVNHYLPEVKTSVNFRAGLRAVLTPETADWFLMGREKAVTMMWNEDWLNTYGWRNNGIQLVSYYVELMRTAARKHNLPIGGFLIMMGHAKLKSYSALAHGSRYLSYWRYGPSYANYLPYSWSNSPSAVREVATIARDVGRIQGTLIGAKREPAKVALLHCKTDPLWGIRQTENRLVYFALLHDQIPVDVITEAEVEEDGILDNYKVLYVTDISVRQQALGKIAEWLRKGGNLWLSGGGASRNEFNEPCSVLTSLMKIEHLSPEEGKFSLRTTEKEEYSEILTKYPVSAEGTKTQTIFNDQTPARITGRVEKGKFSLCMFRPGEYYEKTVRPYHNRSRGKGKIQKGWSRRRREQITGFALKQGIRRPISVNVPCVETMLYRSSREDLAMFINYTGIYPCNELDVNIVCTRKVKEIESLRRGKLNFTQESDTLAFKLALDQVDTVIIRY